MAAKAGVSVCILSIAGTLMALLTGCDQLGASVGLPVERPQEGRSSEPPVIIGDPVAGNSLATPVEGTIQVDPQTSGNAQSVGAPGTTLPATFPPDGPEYQAHIAEVQAVSRTGVAGRLLAVPTQVSANGYPIYPATCTFYPGHAECKLANGEVVDEDYLRAHTTVIRNIDVLHGGMVCGVVCVDSQGAVLAHVSHAMQEWRGKHCRWQTYGKASCNE